MTGQSDNDDNLQDEVLKEGESRRRSERTDYREDKVSEMTIGKNNLYK